MHLGDDAIGRARLVGIAQIGLGLLTDLVAEIEADFVVYRQRSDRHAHLLADILDQCRGGAFAQQGKAFLHIGPEAARGVETAAVVHHDRCLADRSDIIQRLGDGFRAGFLANDDFDQRHFFDRREEVDADEIGRLAPRLGEAGDRQRGCVGAEDHIVADYGFGGLGDIGLDLAGFEHRFNDQVAAGQIGIVRSRLDAIKDDLRLGRIHALLGQPVGGILLALFRRRQVAVEQHDLDAGLRRHHGHARAHQASAQHADLLRRHGRNALGTTRALFGGLFRNKQAADHVAGLGIGNDLGEIFGFNTDGRVHRHLGAFIDSAQDRLGRVHVIAGIHVRHGGAAHEHLRESGVERGGRAARHLEILGIPRLHTASGVGLHPRLGGGDDLIGGHHGLRDAKAQGLLRAHVLALQQVHQRRLDAHQARQALGATGAGEQADHDFRQAERDLGIVGNHPVMAGEDEFEPAAQCQAIDGRRDRLAAGFQIAQQLVEAEHAIEQRGHLRFAFGNTAAAEQRAHALQISPGHEAAGLAGGKHGALHGVVGLQPLDGGGQIGLHFRRYDVHRLAGHIDGEQEDAVGIEFGVDGGGHVIPFLFSSSSRRKPGSISPKSRQMQRSGDGPRRSPG